MDKKRLIEEAEALELKLLKEDAEWKNGNQEEHKEIPQRLKKEEKKKENHHVEEEENKERITRNPRFLKPKLILTSSREWIEAPGNLFSEWF